MEKEEKKPLKKILLICSKASIEDVYAALVMGNGAVYARRITFPNIIGRFAGC